MDEYFKLFAYLTAPIFLSIIIIKIAFRVYNSRRISKQKDHETIYPFLPNSSKGLAEQGYLWLSILAPTLYFIVLGIVAWQGYSISLTAEGFSEFLNISKLPIGLLSLSIPLSILVARIHATHQTSLQIAATQTQIAATRIQIAATQAKNNMDGYYAHRKAMFEYFGALNPTNYPGEIVGDFHAHPRLHLRFFKDLGPINGTPEINTSKFKSTIQTLAEVQQHIETALLATTALSTAALNYADACNKIYSLAGILTLPNIYELLKNESDEYTLYDKVNLSSPNNIKFIRIGDSTEKLIGAYRYVRSFMRVLCEFAGYDVSFFDRKTHYEIDKGNKYNTHPYRNLDISQIIYHSQPNALNIISAQIEAKNAKLPD